ncbi:hypothetical protein DIDNDMLP_00339 [Klebsiella phage KP13-7]|nr:hypothetical protein DIDNDMLP_00339 [Klebsiella phage KP13-7]
MPKLDAQYCDKLLNALITIQKNIKKEKSIQIYYNDSYIIVQCNPDGNYVEFSFKKEDVHDCISIDLHEATPHQSLKNIIKAYKRTTYAFDTLVHRYKTFYCMFDTDEYDFNLVGFDENNIINIPYDFDDELYFQYSTLYSLPPQSDLELHKSIHKKCKNELPNKSVVRISYLSIELDQQEMDEILESLYSLVPVFKH